jgi:[ribosomal protein S18]-alanine N-acetyltransferase
VKKPEAAHIRPLRSIDIRACAAIVAQSEPWIRLGEGIDFERMLRYEQRKYAAYVYTAGSKVAGFIIFSPYPVFARGGYLRSIAVDPTKRKQGIGGKLLAMAERKTALLAPNFYLCVSSFNRKAQTFYKKLGYKRVGSIPGLILPNASEHIYWKQIKRR